MMNTEQTDVVMEAQRWASRRPKWFKSRKLVLALIDAFTAEERASSDPSWQ